MVVSDWRSAAVLPGPTIVVALTSAALFCLVLLFQPVKRWTYRHIPGPYGWPLLGNVLQLGTTHGHEGLLSFKQKYGSLYKLWVGSDPWVVVADAEAARKVHIRFNDRRSYPPLHRSKDETYVSMSGLVEVNGPQWRIVHNAWQPVFQQNRLAEYLTLMDVSVLKFVARLSALSTQGPSIDVWRELGSMTMAVLCSVAFGVDFDSNTSPDCTCTQGGKEITQAAAEFFEGRHVINTSPYNVLATLLPCLRPILMHISNIWPDKRLAKFRMAVDKLRKAAAKLMEDQLLGYEDSVQNGRKLVLMDGTILRDSEPPASNRTVDTKQSMISTTTADFVNMMGRSKKLTKFEILAQATTVLLAGYETTASTIAMVLYSLSHNTAAEQALLQEVDDFGRDRTPQLEDLDRLPFLDAVIKEALRLHGPVPVTTRLASEEIEVCGHIVAKGSVLLVPYWAIHHDPDVWPEPWEFRPERFLPGGPAAGEKPRGYMPFGAGARMCIGQKFAMQEVKLTLLRLYQRFMFRPVDGAERGAVRFRMSITLAPIGGVHLRVIPRA